MLIQRQKLGTFKLEQFLHTVTPPPSVNYRLCVPQNSYRLDVLLWQVYFQYPRDFRCTMEVFLAGMVILNGVYGYVTCVWSEINECRADPGGPAV